MNSVGPWSLKGKEGVDCSALEREWRREKMTRAEVWEGNKLGCSGRVGVGWSEVKIFSVY